MFEFLEDLGKNVTSRLFTCFHYIHKEKTAPPPGGHVFPLITTIFKLVRDIYIVNVLTDFRERPPPPDGHVSFTDRTILELNRRIQEAENVTSRVTRDKIVTKPACSARPPARQPASPPAFANLITSFFLRKTWLKMTPPWRPWIQTIFELNHRIQKTNVLTKFHEDWATNVSS
ncbi:hypothetical protein DPMN_183955 [Dreissena polymorpha]|uniref:Uncharacterized protein n=1 Tax=Dreissena polymorpha TaxID=45954 RepID=A0A9D4I7F6_DREPO|nr:hypothetical protein DPMN_183955 [Dreissena polymorpha]